MGLLDYRDKDNPGNGEWFRRPGVQCATEGCENIAGNVWEQSLCVDCNIRRIDALRNNLASPGRGTLSQKK